MNAVRPPGPKTANAALLDDGAALKKVTRSQQQQDSPEPSKPQAGHREDWAFDWQTDAADVIVPTQLAIAAYVTLQGMVAIRQERDEFEEFDSVVLVHPQHIPALIARLQRLGGSAK